MDIVLETPSIMAARESALWCLSHLFGRSGREAMLEDDLIAMHCKRNYWRRHAEDAEKALDFSQKQASAAFEQACLLSMYIPSAHPEDTPGAGPSSQPLEECLVPPRGGSGVMPASAHLIGEHCSHSRSRSPVRSCFCPGSLGTIFGDMVVNFAQQSESSRPSLAGRFEEPEETMFPLLGRGEVPNCVQVLLDGKKFLHIQFNDCVYQFEEPHRRDVLRNINRGIAPPITGAIWPGAVPLLNTKAKLDRLYALVAQESDEQNLPNTRLGQKFVAWLNRYMGDTDCVMGKSPPKLM